MTYGAIPEAEGWVIPLTIRTVLRTVRVACVASKGYNAKVAISYIDAVPDAITQAVMTGDSPAYGLKVQIMYILCNLGWWRGDTARRSKGLLKGWADSVSYPKTVTELLAEF